MVYVQSKSILFPKTLSLEPSPALSIALTLESREYTLDFTPSNHEACCARTNRHYIANKRISESDRNNATYIWGESQRRTTKVRCIPAIFEHVERIDKTDRRFGYRLLLGIANKKGAIAIAQDIRKCLANKLMLCARASSCQ